ncbi:expressed protein [Echinococcus multilocularis]|uniref:Expressed protein n=1 Tax=Echinococcus multilocularis TaxID=6211 RepID=A0A068Y7X1_ECHMU|nr:expressed protein [Echinococcus multilocularis]
MYGAAMLHSRNFAKSNEPPPFSESLAPHPTLPSYLLFVPLTTVYNLHFSLLIRLRFISPKQCLVRLICSCYLLFSVKHSTFTECSQLNPGICVTLSS